MTVRQPRYSKEEFARRGHEFYESQVRSQIEEGNQGKIVAIDIETGTFEVADDSLTAAKSREFSKALPLLRVISKPDRSEGAGSLRPYSNGFCPQCRGELRSPKRYIIKAQVPYHD
jgi:hypothetical protein